MIIDYIHYLFIFILVWWLIFFIVLPFGVKVPKKQKSNKWASSAPINTKLTMKMILTTVLSFMITTGYYIVMSN
ncbi:MAG: DUF1467 family protein [Rickettsiaceae bacterium H1]|nr:DUF1467 family protein [Rickettsiaceae bacterium H1]